MIAFRSYWTLQFSGGGGPATRMLTQRLGACLAWLAGYVGMTPNHLTLLSLLTSVGAALMYAALPPGWLGILTCLLLYQLAYGFDCADGQLARATGRTSEFGAWLDISVDMATVLGLSFAMLYWLMAQSDAAAAGYVCVAILTLGRMLSVFSSHTVKASSFAQQHRPFSLADVPKKALWLVFDTPVFLAVACLLRDYPAVLMAYALAMGVVYTGKASYLGLRLQRV